MRTLKRCTPFVFAAAIVLLSAARSQAQPIPISDAPPEMANNWQYIDQDMSQGDFFNGTWTITTGPAGATLYVTDWAVASDQFGIYNNGVFMENTAPGVQWTSINPSAGPFDSSNYYTLDANAAWSSIYMGANVFSQATIPLAPNTSYAFTFTDINIPVSSVGGPPFPDGTIAFTAYVPEPSTLVLMAPAAAIGLVYLRRRQRVQK